jgi:hypothetical protein
MQDRLQGTPYQADSALNATAQQRNHQILPGNPDLLE